jgi:plastocyanin
VREGWVVIVALFSALSGLVAAEQPVKKPTVVATAPSTRSASTAPAGGTVSGRVSVGTGRAVPEMIVYLDPLDPKFTFDPPGEAAVVSQQDAKFAPGLLIVPVGAKVEFRNDEKKAVEHNVFSNSGAKKFDLGLYKPGKSIAVEFDKPGAVRLRCSIHRYMDGVVYVAPSPFFAAVAKDGSFTITGVKPGNYK